METSRRHLLRSLGAATAAGAVAGCPLRDGESCRSAADSLETTVADGDRPGLDALEGAWPMRYNDAGATGYAAEAGPRADVERRRVFEGGGSFFPSLVVGGGRVYVTSRGAELLALDPAGPGVEWRYDRLDPGGSAAAVAADRGLVLVASGNGLHAVDAATGERRWLLEGPQLAPDGVVLLADDTAFASTWEAVVAVDLETGERRWRADGAYLEAVADGRVYASVEPGVHAVDAADGSTLWRNEDVEAPGAVAVRDDTVYVGGGGEWGHLYEDPGRLEALDVADGSERWTFRSDETEHFRSPAVAPDSVALASVYRNVYVLDREGGERRWCADFGPRGFEAPAVGDDALYLAAEDVVQARRLDDGDPLWTYRVDADERLDRDVGDFYHHQAVSDGVLFVAGLGRRGLVVDAFLEG